MMFTAKLTKWAEIQAPPNLRMRYRFERNLVLPFPPQAGMQLDACPAEDLCDDAYLFTIAVCWYHVWSNVFELEEAEDDVIGFDTLKDGVEHYVKCGWALVER